VNVLWVVVACMLSFCFFISSFLLHILSAKGQFVKEQRIAALHAKPTKSIVSILLYIDNKFIYFASSTLNIKSISQPIYNHISTLNATMLWHSGDKVDITEYMRWRGLR